jgi:hypothetical protein
LQKQQHITTTTTITTTTPAMIPMIIGRIFVELPDAGVYGVVVMLLVVV